MPSAPSATVLNIAKALIGDRDIGIKYIGMRPGEKIHEIMVSEEEVNHCVKRGHFYVIRPMLPELRKPGDSEPNALGKEFSSADMMLDFPGTVSLLKKHGLMVEDVQTGRESELLR